MLINVSSSGRIAHRRRLGEIPEASVYSKNTWFFEGKDGLGKLPNFFVRYASASNLSREVDAVRSEREASGVASLERALAANVDTHLRAAARYYEWDSVFGRSRARQQQLDGALSGLDAALNDFLSRVPGALNEARAAIQARIAAEQRAAQERIDSQRAIEEAARRAAEAKAAASLLETTTVEKAIVVERAELVTAQAEATKEVAVASAAAQRAMAPKLAGMTYGTAAAVGAALVGGIYWMSTQKKRRR